MLQEACQLLEWDLILYLTGQFFCSYSRLGKVPKNEVVAMNLPDVSKATVHYTL